MSNFSFSHSVFSRLVLQTRQNKGLFFTLHQYFPSQVGLSYFSLSSPVFIWKKLNQLQDSTTFLTLYSIDTHFNASTTCRQLLKTLWERKKLFVTSNFFFFHNIFYSTRKLYSYLSIFSTTYLYLLLNWKSPKLAYEVKGQYRVCNIGNITQNNKSSFVTRRCSDAMKCMSIIIDFISSFLKFTKMALQYGSGRWSKLSCL